MGGIFTEEYRRDRLCWDCSSTTLAPRRFPFFCPFDLTVLLFFLPQNTRASLTLFSPFFPTPVFYHAKVSSELNNFNTSFLCRCASQREKKKKKNMMYFCKFNIIYLHFESLELKLNVLKLRFDASKNI